MSNTLIRVGDFTFFRNQEDYDTYFDELMDEGSRAQWGDPADPPVEFPFFGRQVLDDGAGYPVEFLVVTLEEARRMLDLLTMKSNEHLCTPSGDVDGGPVP